MGERSIIYVFTATKWQNINFVPALALGPIDQLVVLVAERGGRFQHLDEQNAIVSAQGFAHAYREELKSKGINREPRVAIEQGPVLGVKTWRNKVGARLAGAPQNARIVFNYLSGPTDVKIGAWLALDDLARARKDLEIDRVAYDADSQLSWVDKDIVEPVGHRLSLASWLALAGRVETDGHREQRLVRQQQVDTRMGLIRAARTLAFEEFAGIAEPRQPVDEGWYMRLATRLQPNRPNDLLHLAGGDSALACAQRSEVTSFCRAFGEFMLQVGAAFGPEAEKSDSAAGLSPAVCRFLSSDWFEELVYAELRDRAPDAEVALDLKVTPASSIAGRNQFAVDVALLASNQLHIVEAKAHNPHTAGNERRTWIDQTHGYREALVGPGGYSSLAVAAKFDTASESREWARLRQVRIAAGWEEIDRELDELASAAQSSKGDV
jgi:hypothetical protein